MLFDPNGTMSELTASGATTYTPRQAREVFELLDLIRERGSSSPEFVAAWCKKRPRALLPVVAGRLRAQGFNVRGEDHVWMGWNRNTRSEFVAAEAVARGVTEEELAQLEALARRANSDRPKRPYREKDGRPEDARAPWDSPVPTQRQQGEALLDE